MLLIAKADYMLAVNPTLFDVLPFFLSMVSSFYSSHIFFSFGILKYLKGSPLR